MPSNTGPATSTIPVLPSATSTPQPRLTPVAYGPEADDFPSNVNPLTGREVLDPSLLQFPAVLVSISNMPVTARPQAGPGFAPWVYELFIGEGTTRFLNVFYGDLPRAIPNITGGCQVREEIADPAENWIGNRVWLDENENGQQDAWEAGVGGICIILASEGNLEQTWGTSTDSNGYFSFDQPVDNSGQPIDGNYELRFELPGAYTFTAANIGSEDTDSDVDPETWQTPRFQFDGKDNSLDAGLILSQVPVASPTPVVTGTPPNWFFPSEAYVGPVRSGRLTYNQIGGMFPNSCLAYAGAAWDVGERLDACEIVYGVDQLTPNSA
ncbi:MAG TPA: SdrD B-like domain-containing protein, partial [Anaerolineales bacterium]